MPICGLSGVVCGAHLNNGTKHTYHLYFAFSSKIHLTNQQIIIESNQITVYCILIHTICGHSCNCEGHETPFFLFILVIHKIIAYFLLNRIWQWIQFFFTWFYCQLGEFSLVPFIKWIYRKSSANQFSKLNECKIWGFPKLVRSINWQRNWLSFRYLLLSFGYLNRRI